MIRNILKIILSNGLFLISSILIGFVIPRVFSFDQYSMYKQFTLIILYFGVLHFGFHDGIYMKYSGTNYNALDYPKFKAYFRFIIIYQSILFFIVLGTFKIFTDYSNAYIVILSLHFFTISILGYFVQISQLTMRFNVISKMKTLNSILLTTYIAMLLLLNFFGIEILNYSISITLFLLLINLTLIVFMVFNHHEIVFSKEIYRINYTEVKKLFVYGIPLLISNLLVIAIMTFTRQYVAVIFDDESFSIFAFAFTLIGFANVFVTAISNFILPILRTYNKSKSDSLFEKTANLFFIIIPLGLFLYYPLKIAIIMFVPTYLNSISIFALIFPGYLLTVFVSLILHSYYKLRERLKTFSLITFFCIVIQIFGVQLIITLNNSLTEYAILTFVTFIIWGMSLDYFMGEKKTNFLKRYFFVAIMFVTFYLVNYYSTFISLLLLGMVYVILTLVFWHSELFNLYLIIKKRNYKNKSN